MAEKVANPCLLQRKKRAFASATLSEEMLKLACESKAYLPSSEKA
jgi:hypothetical protein